MAHKIIVRADDIGYSHVYDEGAFQSIDQGVVTAADVMLDGESAYESLERLRDYSWISVGWHTHFWNTPVLMPEKVPSMMDRKTQRFRRDLSQAQDTDFDEILAELDAEMQMCIQALGRTPDTGPGGDENSAIPFQRAMGRICREYGIACHFSKRVTGNPDGTFYIGNPTLELEGKWERRKGFMQEPFDKKWEKSQIYMANPMMVMPEIMEDSLEKFMELYDPVKYYTEDRCHLFDLPEDAALGHGWHPGNLDMNVVYQGDNTSPIHKNFLLCRVMDIEALCSQRLKDWIIENKIELVSFRDQLYGMNDYQRHLKNIKSPLCVL